MPRNELCSVVIFYTTYNQDRMKSMKKLYIIDVVLVFSLLIIACSDKDVDNVDLSMTSDDGTFGCTG